LGKTRVKRFAGIPKVETKVEKKPGIRAVSQDLKGFFQASVLEDAAVPGPLSPYRALAIFWDTIPIFTSSVQIVVFMETACSELRLVLRQSNWKRSFGTKPFPRCA